MFGLSVRLTGPLAIMPSADRVPVKSSHSTMLWVLGPLILAPFEHQSLQGTVIVCPTVGKYRLQVVTVFPEASVSTLLLS